jgi:hypothetical protein
MNAWRRVFVALIGLGLAAALLAACSPSYHPSEVVKTVEVEKTVITKPTQAGQPAAEGSATAAVEAPPATPPPGPTLVPSTPQIIETQAPIATAPLPGYTPPAPGQAITETRRIELEWPATLRLGDSDIVRLTLLPDRAGYTITTEFPEHPVITQTVPVLRPAGYTVAAIARLEGVGFELAPTGEQAAALPLGEPVTWRWTLRAQAPGQQRLSVTLTLRWTPLPGGGGQVHETTLYSKALNVRVTSFFGLSHGQTLTFGLVGLVFGGGLSLGALASALRPRRKTLQLLSPNPKLVIEPHPGFQVSPPETYLLRAIFGRYARLVLESEFLSGYSGARTFLALPIRPDGRSDAYTIVKLGERSSIQREFENYETFVKDTLPPITARIQHPPVAVPGNDAGRRAALQYTFIGAPGQSPLSLRQALLANPDPALLHKLFATFGPNWWMQRRPYTFRLAQEYDSLLPTHLVVEPVGSAESSGSRPRSLSANTIPAGLDFAIGDLVTLRGFREMEHRPDGQSLALRGVPTPGQPPLRVRWLSLADPNGATGRVVGTRYSLLAGFVQGLELYGRPDPLARLPGWLNENVSGSQSTIHGDLNCENILVGPGGFVWLIDFAQTRDGHPLIDFGHLEAELIAHIIAPQLTSADDFLANLAVLPPLGPDCLAGGASLPAPYNLLTAVHAIAARSLFNPSQPREYYLALALSCLGALKYSNLSPAARHLLYLTAAHLSQHL